MKSIVLSNGTLTRVDEEDYGYLSSGFWWWHHKDASHPLGYAQGQHKTTRKHVYMHRVIAERVGNDIRGCLIDHWNLDTLDNQRANLRIATHSQSQHNKRIYRNNTSGHKGVSWHSHTKKWAVQVSRSGKIFSRLLVGNFELACDAADMLRRVAHGEFANLS